MDFAELLKSRVDIVSTIGEYVRLKRVGSGPRYVGLCPFHQEKTPSFSVHSVFQFYKCFGCGKGGDVLNFVMEIDSLPFVDALKLLAERNGVPMPKRAEYSDPESKKRAALLEMHEIAAALFESNLKSREGAAAREYLRGRAVTEQHEQEFGLGYSEASGQQLARRFQQNNYTAEQMEESGLVMKRQDGSGWFDRFRGRLMFPIHNEAGKVIAFGGRALRAGDEPKYLNSADTPLYHKKSVLYNLHRAKDAIRKGGQSILVEGYMDVIGVASAGVAEVVATCGTALTNVQVRALKRHSEKMVVNFDPDTAGSNAAERSIPILLDEDMQVRVLQLEGGLDPDAYIQRNGADAYRKRLEAAPTYFHWMADRARQKFDMRSVEGRMEALEFLLPPIQRITDRLERAAIANDLGAYLGIDPGLVLERFRKTATERRDRMEKPTAVEIPAVEKLLINSLLASEEARGEVLPKLREMDVWEQFVTRNVFRVFFTLHQEGGPVRYSDLITRLQEPEKNLLSSLVFADEVGEESQALRQAQDCLRSLEAQHREQRRSSLRARIKTAEQGGNLPEALKLAEELNRLTRR